ncbi:DNA-binding transcriptional activator of the SARP family [Arthrobacter sp. VKM Ac-2550]|nr:DNA-binding transcriptional activator of the SARP family [Arthrobacter sp. VKM Ac-2550]
MSSAAVSKGKTSREYSLSLLQCWRLSRDDEVVSVALRQQRLIAAVAIAGPAPRNYLSGLLWPDSPELRSSENLRVSVHYVTRDLPGLLDVDGRTLGLGPRVQVDLHDLWHELSRPEPETNAMAFSRVKQWAELLPGWYDEWVTQEQRRLLQMRVSYLERLAAWFLEVGKPPKALEAAASTLSLEPVNEIALTLLVRAHLALGNRGSALRALDEFEETLYREFGVSPSIQISGLMDSIRWA